MAGRGLGTLTLDLVVKMGGFVRGMNAAERQTDKSMRAMEKRAKQFGKYLGTALAGVATAAIGLYIKNTIEAEKVQAQLAARIKDTAGAAARSLQELNAQADKLQGLTIFDDEAIGEAQAALLIFKNVQGLNFDRTIEAATDLATVMGTDVADAARLLGKALEDPEAGMSKLRKAGIILNEEQQNTIKAMVEVGNVAGAQSVILDQLSATMGSAAEASRNTLGGALQGLKNDFDNLMEGDSGSEGVIGATQAINDLAASMRSQQVKDGFATVADGLVTVATQAGKAIGFIIRMAQVFGQTLAFVGKEASNLIDLQVAGATFNIEGVKKAREAMVGEYRLFQEAHRKLVNGSEQIAASAKATTAAANSFAANGSVVIHGGEGFGSDKGKGGGSRRHREDNSREEAIERMRKQIEEADKATQTFRDQLQDLRDEVAGPLAQALTDHNRKLAELDALQKEGHASTEELNAAKEAEIELYNRRVEAIEKQLNPLAQVIEQQERELALMGLTGAALQTASDLYGASAEQVAKYGDAIRENNEQLEKMAEQKQLMDGLRASAEDAFASFIDGSKSAKDAFGDFVQSIQTMLARLAAQKLVEQLLKAFGNSFGGGGGDIPTTGDFFGSAKGNAFVHGRLTPFAKGGIVSGPTVFPMRNGMGLMGEAGPEAVMPLARDSRGRLGVRGGGGNVYQTINVQGRPDDRTALQIQQRAQEKQTRAMSRNR